MVRWSTIAARITARLPITAIDRAVPVVHEQRVEVAGGTGSDQGRDVGEHRRAGRHA
jgi:hypothetical protein